LAADSGKAGELIFYVRLRSGRLLRAVSFSQSMPRLKRSRRVTNQIGG
jgi:hypothetical protein